jgi:ATP-binding cassette subfamily B protein
MSESTPAGSEGDRRTGVPDSARTTRPDDLVALAVEARNAKGSFGDFPRIVRAAFGLVWRAAPAELIFTLTLTFGTAVLALAQIYLAREALNALVDTGPGNSNLRPLVVASLALALVSALLSSIGSLQAQRDRLLGQLVTRETTRQMMDVTTGVPLSAYEGSEFHDHLLRVQTHALTRPYELAKGVTNLLAGLVTSVAVLFALLLIQPLLVPALLLTGVPMYIVGRSNARAEFNFSVRQSANFRERSFLTRLLVTRESAKELRAFDLSAALRERWEARFEEYVTDLRSDANERTWLTLVGAAGSAILAASAILLLMSFVWSGRMTLAEAGAAIIALRMLATRSQQSASGMSAVYGTRLFLEDFDRFLKTPLEAPPEVPGEGGRRAAPRDFSSLQVRNLSFRYPGSEHFALQDVDLDLGRGEVVALVGENGSGKTTLASLLAQLYSPSSGTIAWDGVDTEEFAASSLRDRIAVIFQDFVKYPLNGYENIGLGRVAAIDDLPAIERAAQHAGAAEFLRRLPAGFDTPLNKAYAAGHDLSVGQWQRVAIARAFFRDAPFVILDEPTAALDPRAEHDLFDRIRDLLTGRTVLLISHRFSSVRSADRIYVLAQGRIVEHGNHDQLMERRGLYQELFELQASAYLNGRGAAGEPVTPRSRGGAGAVS